MSAARGLRRTARAVALAAFLLATGLVVAADATPEANPGWVGFEAERAAMIRTLANPVLACVDRVDPRARDSPMFHGCGDWHNALAGHYALYVAYRHTGDVGYLRAAERQIQADKVEAERQFLPQLVNPQNWRRYYGFPWLLAMLAQRDAALVMARQLGHPAGDGIDLRPLAQEAVTWLRDWLSGLDTPRGREHVLADQYVNLSWTVINLIRWARHTGDEALLGLTRAVADAHLRPAELDTACPLRRDTGATARQFIPPCLMRLAAIAELDGTAAKAWIDARLPVDFHVPPLTAPLTAQATGLNFHRAATLLALHKVTGRTTLRDNAALLIRFHIARPYQWRDDYRQHAQWIPMFGIHAIEESYA